MELIYKEENKMTILSRYAGVAIFLFCLIAAGAKPAQSLQTVEGRLGGMFLGFIFIFLSYQKDN